MTDVRAIQKHLGIPADGVAGPQTWAAIAKALGVAAEPVGVPVTSDERRIINKAGLDLIKSFEGMKLAAYKCPAGIWTIGYGSTGPHVKPGMTITAAQAEDLLRQDLRRFEECVARVCPAATDNQFAAMVSLAFNIGCAAFEKSTVAKQHAAGNHKLAAAAFGLWIKAAGKTLAGLVRRRAAEAKLYGAAA